MPANRVSIDTPWHIVFVIDDSSCAGLPSDYLHKSIGEWVDVIGSNWLEAKDQLGRRRLDEPSDVVRVEIAAALQRNIPVIPILLEGTRPPGSDQLPTELRKLARLNALDVRHTSFHEDMDKLIRFLARFVRTDGEAGATEKIDNAAINL